MANDCQGENGGGIFEVYRCAVDIREPLYLKKKRSLTIIKNNYLQTLSLFSLILLVRATSLLWIAFIVLYKKESGARSAAFDTQYYILHSY